MGRRQELGWPRGYYAARERIPAGYARIRNAEFLGDAALRSVRGAAVLGEVVGKNFRHGARFVSRTGVKGTIVISADGEVRNHDGAGFALLGTIAASQLYSSAQTFDRLYIATGGAAGVVAESAGAVTLVAGPAGLATPPAPALSFLIVSDPADPPVNQALLALQAPRAEIYGLEGAGTAFRRYGITTNAWASRAPVPAARSTFPTLGTAATGRLVYWPGWTGSQQIGLSTHKDAYWYDPATDLWTGAKPFTNDTQFYWEVGAQVIDGQTAFGNGKTYASMWRQGSAELQIAEIAELPTESDVVATHATGLPTSSSSMFRIVASEWPFIWILQTRNAVTYFRRIGVDASTSTVRAVPPTSVTFDDQLVFDPASPDKIWLFKAGSTTYYEYTISADSWTTQTFSVAPGVGLTGAAPVERRLFFFASSGSTDFRSALLPGVPAGGTGSYRVQVQWENDFGASNVSPIAQIDNVPDGATIRIDFPQPPDPAATRIVTYRNASKSDLNTIGKLQVDPIATLFVTTPASPVTVGPPPPPAGGGGAIPHAKYVAAHLGRTWWGNIVGAPSDVAYSLAAQPETIDPAARLSFAPNDGDEITGLASIPLGLIVFKRRSIHAFIGEPADPPDFETSGFPRVVAVGVGCAAPRSVAVSGDRVYFAAEDGVYYTDGRGAVWIGEAVDDLFPIGTAVDAIAGFVDGRGRYHVCLDSQRFQVFDPVAERWEAELSFEAHRTAGVAAGFAAPDLGRRLAVAGARVIRFAEAGLPASAADPFEVETGPHGDEVFEDDVAILFVFVRYKGDLNLVWKADASALPEAARTIALGVRAATGTTMTRVPAACSGRRLLFAVRSADAGDATLEAISLDVQPLGRLAGAP